MAPTYGLTRAIYELARAVVFQHFAHRVLEDEDKEYRLVVQNLAGGKSVMEAKSADNSVSLLGEGLDWLILDEAARVRRVVWEQHLSQRLIDRKGWALLLSTPRGTGWFHEAFRRGQKGRDAAFESWQSASWTNPHLDRELIEAERTRLSREAFEQEYEARFLGAGLVERCDRCEGPSDTILPVLVLRGEEEAPKCPDCDGYVFQDGKTAVMRSDNPQFGIKIRRMPIDEPREWETQGGEFGTQRPELN